MASALGWCWGITKASGVVGISTVGKKQQKKIGENHSVRTVCRCRRHLSQALVRHDCSALQCYVRWNPYLGPASYYNQARKNVPIVPLGLKEIFYTEESLSVDCSLSPHVSIFPPVTVSLLHAESAPREFCMNQGERYLSFQYKIDGNKADMKICLTSQALLLY